MQTKSIRLESRVHRNVHARFGGEATVLLAGFLWKQKESRALPCTYIGGKPRYRKKYKDKPKSKQGRGTNKAPVAGLIEHGGKVITKSLSSVSGESLKNFLLENIEIGKTILMTDGFAGYKSVDNFVDRRVIKHSEKKYVEGEVYTNTIEGFWSEVKRAFHGTHHWYSKKWLPLYLQEACFKRNHRHDKNLFIDFLKMCV